MAQFATFSPSFTVAFEHWGAVFSIYRHSCHDATLDSAIAGPHTCASLLSIRPVATTSAPWPPPSRPASQHPSASLENPMLSPFSHSALHHLPSGRKPSVAAAETSSSLQPSGPRTSSCQNFSCSAAFRLQPSEQFLGGKCFFLLIVVFTQDLGLDARAKCVGLGRFNPLLRV